MRPVKILVLASTMLASMTGTALAQQFVTPFIGYNFGGNSVNCESFRNCDVKHTNIGVSMGKTNRLFGVEQDISYARHFFGDTPGSPDSMLTAMSSFLVAAPLGRLQPYGLFGVGLMRASTAAGKKNMLGYDIGAGMNLFLTDRFGLRGDMRRMRSLHNVTLFIFSGEKMEFWRASLGIVLR